MTPAANVATETTSSQVHAFIREHVLYHMGGADAWNLPFLHISALDVFKYDQVMLPFALVILLTLLLLGRRGRGEVPRGLANALEAFVLFIRDRIAIAYLGDADGRRMTPYFCSLFSFIMVMNLLGLVPLFSAATSNISVTVALALCSLALIVVGAIHKRGLGGFLRSFVPPGVPRALLPLLVPIEVISLFSRTFALTVRLFANILAGHIILFALTGLVVILGLVAAPVVLLAVAIFFFEIFVAIFQAYIFTLLSAIFMGQLTNAEH